MFSKAYQRYTSTSIDFQSTQLKEKFSKISKIPANPWTWKTSNSNNSFKKGDLQLKKTQQIFSRISDDQAYKQNNKVIKESDGAIGIFDSLISLAKWMIAVPQIA